MTPRMTLIQLLKALLKEMDVVQSQGAGYYTCIPFARRFNKLLNQGLKLYGDSNPILESFDRMDETDPKDPAEKSKRLLEIRIEITQLISLLESTDDTPTAEAAP